MNILGREIVLNEKIVEIAKEAGYEFEKTLELDLQILGYSEESDISNAALGRLCSKMIAEDLITYYHLNKALEDGSLMQMLKESEEECE